MFVATAERGSIPNWIIAVTVMREVLPVTTLTMLVTKKMTIRESNSIFFRFYMKVMTWTTMKAKKGSGVAIA